MATETEQIVLSISADLASLRRSMQRGTSTVKTETDRMSDSMRKMATAADDSARKAGEAMRKSAQISGHAAANLRFQLQDLSTQISAGTSPFQALSQQASQLGGALQGLTAGGAIRALGSALLSPWTLLPGLIGVAGAAVAKYFQTTSQGAEEASAKLREHRDIIQSAVDNWKGVPPPQLTSYLAALKEIERAEGEIAARNTLVARSFKPVNDLWKDFTARRAEFVDLMQLWGTAPETIDRVQQAFAVLDKKVQDGTASTRDFDALLKALRDSGVPAVADIANAFERFFGPALAAARKAVDDLDASLKKTAATVQQFPALGTLPPVFSGGGRFLNEQQLQDFIAGQTPSQLERAGPKEFLKTRAANDKIRQRMDALDDRFADALARLLKELPGATIVSGVRTREEQAAIYASGVRPAARPGRSRHERGAAADIGGVSSEALQRAVALIPELMTLISIGDDMHVQMSGAAEGIAATADQTDRLTTSTRQGTEATLASTAATQGMAAAGREAASATTDLADRQQDALAAASELAAVGHTFFSSFIADLREGKDASEALANALSRVVDQLIEMALQAAFAPENFLGLFSGAGSFPAKAGIFGFSGPWGLAGAFQKGGRVGDPNVPQRLVPLSMFKGAPSFARGGVVPILAHAGEVVIPRNAARAGGAQIGNTTRIDNSGMTLTVDMSATGLVTASSADAKAFGLRVKDAVRVTMIEESRPGGLLRKLPTS